MMQKKIGQIRHAFRKLQIEDANYVHASEIINPFRPLLHFIQFIELIVCVQFN